MRAIARKAKMLVAALGVCPICDHRILAVYDGADWTVVMECEHLTGFDGVKFYFSMEGGETVVPTNAARPDLPSGN